MKKTFFYIIMALLSVSACKKNEDQKLPSFDRTPLPQLLIDNTGDTKISAANPSAFNGKITVSIFKPEDTKGAKLNIVVIKNGVKTNVKTLQTNITTFPATVVVTESKLKELFGTSTVLGDNYTFGADVILTDGTLIDAFPASGSRSNAYTASLTNYNANVSFTASCLFNMSDFGAIGTSVPFTIVKDEWVDYAVGATINLKIIDATHLSFVYLVDSNPIPIVIAINASNNSTSVTNVTYGKYGTENYSAVSVDGSADNVVLPCSQTIGVRLQHFDSANVNQGTYTITFKKK
ncbi:hypothetical protein J7E50_05360 [Pedobacter sp. ISL-68]|uniref:hypothetical protein n=1 Tax=unclassified Pedobacter TaxID=2628915 RepID=UPI001BEBE403|nr:MULTISPECIES: hypothetical protein [unclassified Pedobacter]MBT2563744.1 hypothetical protein [Pedobacter sp. ISL-64]MBT2589636.1 hypothetical protein [Pedobacter sp. ISL-68]